MSELLQKLWETDFMPHGHCFLWKPGLIGLHAFSDALIALAYYSIPVSLFIFVRRRVDLHFAWIFMLFAAFILLCGTTHLMAIWTLWTPAYWLEGGVKALTGIVSIGTAAATAYLLPRAVELPGPSELEAANLELRRMRDDLERRVEERTRALTEANHALEREIDRKERAEARVRLVIEAAPNALIRVGRQGRIELVNQQAERLFGYSREQMLGAPIEMLVPGHARPVHAEHRAAFFAAPQARAMGAGRDLYALRRDGTEVPVEIGLNPIETENGLGVLASIVDITRRKQAEDERRRALAEQEEVAEALKRSNEELDEFAYVASHDLREPLRGIQFYASKLKRLYGERLDDEGRRIIGRLTQLPGQLERLVSALLEYSRLGRVDLAVADTDLGAVLDEVLGTLHGALEERGVSVRVPDRLPTVRCDGSRIGEVFRNLISNAAKYNDKDQRWVEIGYQAPRDRGRPDEYVFWVRDNGIGISERHQESVFRIFKRLHAQGEVFGDGTGAGLTIVKKIVERHGGRIWVESQPGEGTTFFFTLAAATATR